MISSLEVLEQSLLTGSLAPADCEPLDSAPEPWLEEADRLSSSKPLLLSIAQQSRSLAGLLQSRRLVITAIEQQRSARP